MTDRQFEERLRASVCRRGRRRRGGARPPPQEHHGHPRFDHDTGAPADRPPELQAARCRSGPGRRWRARGRLRVGAAQCGGAARTLRAVPGGRIRDPGTDSVVVGGPGVVARSRRLRGAGSCTTGWWNETTSDLARQRGGIRRARAPARCSGRPGDPRMVTRRFPPPLPGAARQRQGGRCVCHRRRWLRARADLCCGHWPVPGRRFPIARRQSPRLCHHRWTQLHRHLDDRHPRSFDDAGDRTRLDPDRRCEIVRFGSRSSSVNARVVARWDAARLRTGGHHRQDLGRRVPCLPVLVVNVDGTGLLEITSPDMLAYGPELVSERREDRLRWRRAKAYGGPLGDRPLYDPARRHRHATA